MINYNELIDLKQFLDENGVSHLFSRIAGIFATKGELPTVDEKAIWNAKQDALTIDDTLSPTSTNLVRNKTITEGLSSKVEKVEGKGLSTNDLTDNLKGSYDNAYTHSISAHAPSNAEKNVIIGLQANGADLTIGETRKINIPIPTKTSDLTNDSGFQTSSQVTTAINNAIGDITEIEFRICSTGEYNAQGVPTLAGKPGVFYLVPKSNSGSQNIYTEFIYTNNAFEKIGDTAVDLSGYLKKTDITPLSNAQIDEIINAII